jgi:hypothetical protein
MLDVKLPSPIGMGEGLGVRDIPGEATGLRRFARLTTLHPRSRIQLEIGKPRRAVEKAEID